MTAKSSQRSVRSFSTNFFGVIGYVGLVLVWLLVITCLLALIPVTANSAELPTLYWLFIGLERTPADPAVSPAGSELLTAFLLVLLVPVVWSFCFVASKILSRIVRRCIRMMGVKVTPASLTMAKFAILAVGLVLLAVLTIIIPVSDSVRLSIAFLGFAGGVGSTVAIGLQRRVMVWRKVPIARIL